MIRRRKLTAGAGAMLLAGRAGLLAGRAGAQVPELDPALPAGVREVARLQDLPGKRRLIRLTGRPPNYETPLDAFRTAITPNDRFFIG